MILVTILVDFPTKIRTKIGTKMGRLYPCLDLWRDPCRSPDKDRDKDSDKDTDPNALVALVNEIEFMRMGATIRSLGRARFEPCSYSCSNQAPAGDESREVLIDLAHQRRKGVGVGLLSNKNSTFSIFLGLCTCVPASYF